MVKIKGLEAVLFLWLAPMSLSLDVSEQVFSLLGHLQRCNSSTDNTHISPACNGLIHMTADRLPLISVHFYEVQRKVILCTIT